jgi:hypothetical protein
MLSAVFHGVMRWRGMVALVAVVAVAASIAQTSAGHAMLRKAGLFEKPTSYTSLAFQNPHSLPEQLKAKRASVPISFVIHNVSATPRDYFWSVLLRQGRHRHRVAAGGIRVASGHSAGITRSVQISCTRGQVRIVVNLVHPAESIDASMACWTRS